MAKKFGKFLLFTAAAAAGAAAVYCYLQKKDSAAASDDMDDDFDDFDSDLEEEARVAELLDNQLSENDEDLLDDIGLDMNEIVRTMAEKAKEFPADTADTADRKE